MKKRVFGLAAIVALAISAAAAPAAAFNPPGEPAPHGDCDGVPAAIAGFVGTNGQVVALDVAQSPGAWSAWLHSEQIGLCD